jgi:phosphopantothenoylcysteine decarboxylase / phosphopantothenate---cysteine ligase
MNVVLGVTGGISAYKAVEVLRHLQKAGAAVRVAMTRNARELIAPLTFQAISGYPVITEMFAPGSDPEIKHIELAGWMDLLLIAPATANTLAKFANGIADDFISTLYISATAPVLVAPAMNVEMWLHPATQENISRLVERGVRFIDPEEGYLACRSVGPGRLAEPSLIAERALRILADLTPAYSRRRDLEGENVLVTAGPTYEPIDPVRGITNRSSGRMGYALAEAAVSRGARVSLVTGPVSIEPPVEVKTVRVQSAAEMYAAVMQRLDSTTMVIMAAAVSDYRVVGTASQKIKKKGERLTLELEETEDILAAICRQKGSRVVIGFAAETDDVLANAKRKLLDKRADMIVANDVSLSDSGFDVATNRITLVSASETVQLPLLTKRDAADRILDAALQLKSGAIAEGKV